MSNDISHLIELREQFRHNNPHLLNLPPARNKTPEELLIEKEAKQTRLIKIRKQLEVIYDKRNHPEKIKNVLSIYTKQEQNNKDT